MTPRIRAEDIAFSYSPEMARAVFRNVSLTVRTGDVFCLLGPNGIGKSTLLKCLSGILRIQQGRIFLNGRDLSEFKLPDVAKHIGYVPQGLTSAFPFRIKDIIVMGRAPHLSVLASPSRADMEIAYKAMETVGVVSSCRPALQRRQWRRMAVDPDCSRVWCRNRKFFCWMNPPLIWIWAIS